MTETDKQASNVEAMDIQELMRLLPHRYPFLLVDRIVDIDGDKSAVGIKNVTASEPQFQGHFPSRPIMPGVLMIEGMAQTAGAISIKAADLGQPALIYFMTIDNAKFRRPVVPGDVLEYHVKLMKKRGTVCRYSCVAIVGSEKVAEAELTAMLDVPDAEG